MRSAQKQGAARVLAMAAALVGFAMLTGCGMPATPLPPSLDLPAPVTGLTATRTGDEVSLAWTMPKRDTSNVLLKGSVATRICRQEKNSATCATIASLSLAPGANGTFTESLTPTLAAGSPRALSYFVGLINRKGRSAGLSSAATVLAGHAPAPVSGLSAEVRKDGVVLRWMPSPPEPYETVLRLERTLLTPPAAKPAQGPLSPPAEPIKQNLLVPAGETQGRAIDKNIRLGNTYAYRAQWVTRITADGKALELDGPLSPPVRVEAEDVFPPAVPTSLAAVATPAQNGTGPSIDLSWQPDAETDVAGYAVYRREQGEGAWLRISPAQPVVGPGFHDGNVQPGHTYEYAVTAIGQNGRESRKSAAAQETVPQV